MTTRFVATFRVEDFDDMDALMKRLEADSRVSGNLRYRNANRTIQAWLGSDMDVNLNHRFDEFRDIVSDNSDIIKDAVVVGSNDTINRGLAQYCVVEGDKPKTVGSYKESEEEPYWGEEAAAVMFSKYGINGRSSMFAPEADELD